MMMTNPQMKTTRRSVPDRKPFYFTMPGLMTDAGGILPSLIRKENQRLIASELASLTLREQEALSAIHDLEPNGPSVPELAHQWGCTRQTVYNCGKAAITKLRERLIRLRLRHDGDGTRKNC
jgi:hypothetical protein